LKAISATKFEITYTSSSKKDTPREDHYFPIRHAFEDVVPVVERGGLTADELGQGFGFAYARRPAWGVRSLVFREVQKVVKHNTL
jgi:hypothetical protein